jgi:hypothetical protein
MESEDDEVNIVPTWGMVRCHVRESVFSARVDAAATSHNTERSTLYALSCFGAETTIRSIRASLTASRSIPVELEGCTGINSGTYLSDSGSGYECRVARLGFDLWQLVALSNDRHFLAVHSKRSLLDRLKSKHYTTPILDGWVGWLTEELKRGKLLRTCPSHRCRAGYLLLNDATLDRLVAKGLTEGHIAINKEFAHAE